MPEAGEPIQKALCDAFLKKYWLGWGREGDRGVVALERSTGLPLSCAWIRRFSRQEAGATFVAEDIPELATGTVEGFRGQGIGAETIRSLIASSQEDYRALCLSVREDNPAVRLYQRLGFAKVPRSETRNRAGTLSFNMVLRF